MLSLYKRWRIVKSIESGAPMSRSLAADLEKSAKLRAYADSMQRVHEGLHAQTESKGSIGIAQRVLLEIERESAPTESLSLGISGRRHSGESLPMSRLWPARLTGPVGLAAAVVIITSVSLLTIRPWAATPQGESTIEVTGQFTTLASLFEPLGDENVIARVDQSLANEMNALAQDAQDMAKGVFEGIPGADLIGKNQGTQPDPAGNP
jgi:negative regulator of sigma E activity